MNTNAISVRGITKSFEQRVVVNQVDLDVPSGEIFGFLGPNGSGKTTFLRILCGLLTPDSGDGTCLGFKIGSESSAIRNRVGYMTQRFSFYEDLSVTENLLFIARIYRIPNTKEAVEFALVELGMTDRRKQLAGTLSGGWKQRLALAACLIHRPKLLLLDEPTAGVDPSARRDFWEELHKLAASGLTVLITTHYMDEAERCHRLAYISNGVLLARGTPTELVENSALVTWRVSGPQLSILSAKLEALKSVEQVVAFGNSLHVSTHDGEQLLIETEQYRMAPFSWTEIRSELEDVFINLMNHPPST